MALELAARAIGMPPTRLPDGAFALGGRRIPGSERNTLLLNFAGGDAIPTYSLADLQACAAQGKADFFRAQFAGKVVLVGAVLDVEDRKLTSKRFITGAERPAGAPRCVYPPMEELFRKDLVRDSIPGVYVHATAVDNLLRGDALRELGPWLKRALVLAMALAAAALTMRLAALRTAAALGLGALLWAAIATASFRAGLVLPLLAPLVAAALSAASLLGYRFTVTDRDRRLLRNSFGLYLAPALVDQVVRADRPPQLGGEQRRITVLFSDLAGFSRLSEGLVPAELVAVMNEYLTAMTDIIEREGGYVDKYIGDAITAIFGAPLDDPQHALHAARAALACRDRLEAMNREGVAFRGHRLGARIGLNTGDALVGNIGSRRRFNYTAMGDTVNLASRLEGANKAYGTHILASAALRVEAGDTIAWREVDRVKVVGREGAVTIFEPLGSVELSEAVETAAAFAAAIAAYRERRFAAAAGLFEALAPFDAPARVFAERARRLAADPPPEGWDAVTVLDSK
jgi:class 3 adenylate cyclase